MYTMCEKAGDGRASDETLSAQGVVQGCAMPTRFTSKYRGIRLRMSRGKVRWLLTLTLSAIFGIAGAQSAPNSLPSTTEVGTRAELLELLRRVDAQLAEITEGDQQPDRERLLELKAQFEVLLLQAELEALRRENTSLREQQGAVAQAQSLQEPSEPQNGSDQTDEGQGDADPQVETEISVMQRQFTQLDEQQANVASQLETIASQHAILLKQLGSAPQNTDARPTSVQQDGRSPEPQAELLELRSRFARLNAQQDVVNSQLQTLTDEHAALLKQLGDTAPDTDAQSTGAQRTHVVRPGDSLSKLAKAYYGNGARWPEILQANPSLADPDQLFTGTVLTIP